MLDFQFWLEDLETQTLTNELKDIIIEKVNQLVIEANEEGYEAAKIQMIEHIKENM